MNRQEFLLQSQAFLNIIENYSGPDPLQCHYDYLKWLEQNGIDNVSDTYVPFLQETLHLFENYSIYNRSDVRYAELVLKYINMQSEKLKLYEFMHKKGLLICCSTFYKAWCLEIFKSNVNHGLQAAAIIQSGYENGAEPTSVLDEALQLLKIEIGNLVLSGSYSLSKVSAHATQTKPKRADDAVKNWELKPLKVGNEDKFSCPMFIPDDDPSKICMYPKSEVYQGNMEFQLEEVIASLYIKAMQERIKTEHLALDPDHRKSQDDSQISSVRSSEPPIQVPCDVSVHTQSFTVNTKAAFNIVQEMWNSPTPRGSLGGRVVVPAPKDEFKVPRSEPFGVFADNSAFLEQDNAGQVIRSSTKPLSKGVAVSERKALHPATENIPCATGGVLPAKHVLVFDDNSVPSSHPPVDDAPLASRLDGEPIFPETNPVPNDWLDSDCNTKIFNNFLQHASTPNTKAKLAVINACPPEPVRANETGINHTRTELSVIHEVSKDSSESSKKFTSPPLSSAVSDVESKLASLILAGDIDPFCSELKETILLKVGFPTAGSCSLIDSPLPLLKNSIKLGDTVHKIVSGTVIKGAYAKVVKSTVDKKEYALKIEKPCNMWEYYICCQIARRVDPENVSYFMPINAAFFFKTGSILSMDWSPYGNLLDVVNKHKQTRGLMINPLVAYIISFDIVSAVHYLHKSKIIHGDIKPDNFLLFCLPGNGSQPCVRLTDFGRAIDMTLFPEGTSFTRVVTTDGFKCCEMRDSKPWTYQTDLFGLAGTLYCVFAADYMNVVKNKNVWTLQKNLPRSYSKDVWEPLFLEILNIPDCDHLPSLTNTICMLDSLRYVQGERSHHIVKDFCKAISS